MSIKKIFEKIIKSIKDDGILNTGKRIYYSVRFRTLVKIKKIRRLKIKQNGNIDNPFLADGDYITKKKHLYIFAAIPYYDIGGGQRSAQIAKKMSSYGFSVHYFYCADTNESTTFDIDIPTVEHKHIKECDITTFNEHINEDSIIVIELPHSEILPFINIARKKGAKIIYENIDNWESSLGEQFFSIDTLKNIIKQSDILVGTAKPLVDQLKDYCKKFNLKREVLYSPNAVDDVLFNPSQKYTKPEDFVSGEKTLIYYGSLWGEWFDWDLLFKIAKQKPTYSILLIGEKENIKQIVKTAPDNIHFLGIKKQVDLPAYLSYSDYAMIPFKVDKIGETVSPLKVFEYISMKKPVLSTALPELKNYPETFCSNLADEWIKKTEEKNKYKTNERDLFVSKNNWDNRCDLLLDSLKIKDTKMKIKIICNFKNNKEACISCINNYSERYNYEILKTIDDYTFEQNTMTLLLNTSITIKNKYWLDEYMELSKSCDVICYASKNSLNMPNNVSAKKSAYHPDSDVILFTNIDTSNLNNKDIAKNKEIVVSPFLGIDD